MQIDPVTLRLLIVSASIVLAIAIWAGKRTEIMTKWFCFRTDNMGSERPRPNGEGTPDGSKGTGQMEREDRLPVCFPVGYTASGPPDSSRSHIAGYTADSAE